MTLLETGKIVTTHGVRGEVRAEAWSNALEDLLDYPVFYRADGSRTQGGFGLGLSIAQAIVREHQGTIRCESDARSTRFIVTLPLGGRK